MSLNWFAELDAFGEQYADVMTPHEFYALGSMSYDDARKLMDTIKSRR